MARESAYQCEVLKDLVFYFLKSWNLEMEFFFWLGRRRRKEREDWLNELAFFSANTISGAFSP